MNGHWASRPLQHASRARSPFPRGSRRRERTRLACFPRRRASESIIKKLAPSLLRHFPAHANVIVATDFEEEGFVIILHSARGTAFPQSINGKAGGGITPDAAHGGVFDLFFSLSIRNNGCPSKVATGFPHHSSDDNRWYRRLRLLPRIARVRKTRARSRNEKNTAMANAARKRAPSRHACFAESGALIVEMR